MRGFLFTIIFLSILNAKAQTSVYHPFPDSNAVWRVDWGAAYCALYNYPQAKYQYEVQGDTLLGTNVYHKIIRVFGYGFFICGPTENGYMGGLREDTILHKIYFVPKDSIQEELLYNFNLALGDTVRGYYLETFSGNNLIVTDIDSILIGTTYRKRFKCEVNYPLHTNYLVEGIGNITTGLLEPPEIMDLTPLLCCFSVNGTPVYIVYSPCELPNSIIQTDKEFSYSLFPNPAVNELTILNAGVKAQNIEIYDMLGKKCISPILYKGREEARIDVSLLGKGIYFVRLHSEKGIIIKKLIKQ